MWATTTVTFRKELSSRLTSVYETREADQIASLIIEHLFGAQTTAQLIDKEISISDDQQDQCQQIINKLLDHQPVQYILGNTEFYGRKFKTDPRALIPRPETEQLVDYILNDGVRKDNRVLDIGTGSGCIAITLALEANLEVYALDVDADALKLAEENALSLGAKINFIRSDILTDKPAIPRLHIIVSNPPYVPQTEQSLIQRRVKDYEPYIALFVPDQNPLIYYRKIAKLAPEYLLPGGKVFLEIYHLSGPEVMELFQGSQWFQVTIKKDLQGKDRMIKAILKS